MHFGFDGDGFAERSRPPLILSDNGRELRGRPDQHPYELFLQLEDIEHRTTKVKRPQSNGIVERFHRTLLDEHFRVEGRMTDAAKASVWLAVWQPRAPIVARFARRESAAQSKTGAPASITGSLVLNQRFPGQWFQLESGLHYNWHRHYDPSLGRYTQPDPLGFVDGPAVFAYAGGNPQMLVDPDGRQFLPDPFVPPIDRANPLCYSECLNSYRTRCIVTGSVASGAMCLWAFGPTMPGGACTAGGCALIIWRCNAAGQKACRAACG